MMKRIPLFCLLIVSVFFFGCKAEEKTEKATLEEVSSLTVETQSGEVYDFTVELALTPDQFARGLMHRADLPEDAGMLFYFPDYTPRAFWMKNTLISLDIIYINDSGEISHIYHSAQPNDKTPIPSNGPAKGVLEINGGLSVKLGIDVGDRIKHPFFQ